MSGSHTPITDRLGNHEAGFMPPFSSECSIPRQERSTI
jgi:hypothetical protein